MYGSKILNCAVNCGLWAGICEMEVVSLRERVVSVYCCWLMCSCLLVVAGH